MAALATDSLHLGGHSIEEATQEAVEESAVHVQNEPDTDIFHEDLWSFHDEGEMTTEKDMTNRLATTAAAVGTMHWASHAPVNHPSVYMNSGMHQPEFQEYNQWVAHYAGYENAAYAGYWKAYAGYAQEMYAGYEREAWQEPVAARAKPPKKPRAKATEAVLQNSCADTRDMKTAIAVASLGFGLSGYTTVMVKNIPGQYTQIGLVELLFALGFSGRFDYLHMPAHSSHGNCSCGYAFINFCTADTASDFYLRYNAQYLQHDPDQAPELDALTKLPAKSLCVLPAFVQGLVENASQFLSRRSVKKNARGSEEALFLVVPECFVGHIQRWNPSQNHKPNSGSKAKAKPTAKPKQHRGKQKGIPQPKQPAYPPGVVVANARQHVSRPQPTWPQLHTVG